MNLSYKHVASPVGRLKLVASDAGLAAVLWEDDNPQRVRLAEMAEETEHHVLLRTAKELKEYFSGARTGFSVPLDLRGTDFQKQVWIALRGIPFGETRTYGQLAAHLGRPTATRAVGAANGRNPIGIVVPCHRVIGSSGKLTGFAGGLVVKADLLRLEQGGRPVFEKRAVASTGNAFPSGNQPCGNPPAAQERRSFPLSHWRSERR